MGEIVNLRMIRKRRARAEKERLAEENRLRHGRTRAEREKERLGMAIEAARLESHRRSPADDREK